MRLNDPMLTSLRSQNFARSRLRRHAAHRMVLTLAVLAARVTSANGQERVMLKDDSVAERAGLELVRVLALHEPTRSRSSSWVMPTQVIRDSHGTFYVLDQIGSNPVQAFRAEGAFIRSFPRVQLLVNRSIVRTFTLRAPDTLCVMSGGNAMFDRDGRIVKSVQYDPDLTIWRALGFLDGTVVVRGMFTTADLFGYPLHVLDSTGSRVRSFGAGVSEASDGSVGRINGALSAAARDRFWTAEMDRYEISLWSIRGTRLRVLERDVDWFVPWHAWDGRIDVAPPKPRLLAIRQTRQGKLLTLASVAALDWVPVPGRAAMREAPPPSAEDFERATESIIELIDPSAGTVLASRRFKQTLVDIVDDTLVAGVSTANGGRTLADIWRIQRPIRPGGKS